MKKIPTLFVRDFEHSNGRYVTREVNPGCEWVLAGEGVVTRKWDGTCVRVDLDGKVWARREVKPGKLAPAGFQPIEHDKTTDKVVGWEPAHQSSFSALITEAIANHPSLNVGAGTYELIGPKVNGNPEGYDEHRLIRHGVDIPSATGARTYDDIRADLEHYGYEGFVYWRIPGNANGDMVKIKRRDFPARLFVEEVQGG